MKKVVIAGIAGICLCVLMAAQTKPAHTKPVQTKPAVKQTGISKKILADGKKVYDAYCLACHQADGGGVPRLNPPLQGTTMGSGR